ncbi:hypothetical protein [Apibacter sp. HY039]|uniref:hypothetical protein n=1 Tax=Apibacter sp. HY039 TaxID=2501476 RepID=UPI000FEB5F5B|nr:hypothetical protein [Apibacter sp. HY039]
MKNGEYKYYFLFVLLVAGISFVPFFLSYGGINSDAVAYFKLAKEFPQVTSNLFPIGYPLLLKLGYYFTHEFYFSSRIISVLSFSVIGLFSYYKKFYFKETILLLSFRFYFSLYMNSFSETIFLSIVYFLIYYFHEYISGYKKRGKFIVPASLLTIYMVMIRYSGVYIYIGIGFFLIYHTIRNNLFLKILSQSYFYYYLFSLVGIAIYLSFNYYNFNSFFGEQIRGVPDIADWKMFTYDNLLGVINVINPVFSIKLKNYFGLSILLITIDLLFLLIIIIFYSKNLKKITAFHQMLLITGVTYLILMFGSEYKQSIEPLNMRMLAPASVLLCFSILIVLFKVYPSKKNYMFALGCFSVFFTLINQLKNPVNFLSHKFKIDRIVKEKEGVKYFYDDIPNEKNISIYRIPFTNKKIKYIHPYMQSGFINSTIVRTYNPNIVLIKSDSTIRNKNLIIYNSELR